jgi:WD40 repeat protein
MDGAAHSRHSRIFHSWQAAFPWDAESGMELVRLPGEARLVTRVAFSYDGQYLAGGSTAGVILWNGSRSYEE